MLMWEHEGAGGITSDSISFLFNLLQCFRFSPCNWAVFYYYQRTYNRMARDVILELPLQTHKYLDLSSEIRPVSAGGYISHQ